MLNLVKPIARVAGRQQPAQQVCYNHDISDHFHIATSLLGEPETVWVVGDNLETDVRGAEAVGLPAILVRSPRGDDVRYYAGDLLEAATIVESGR
jgi:ribonucleotide monophosphatase NagD (HAD superfamily)